MRQRPMNRSMRRRLAYSGGVGVPGGGRDGNENELDGLGENLKPNKMETHAWHARRMKMDVRLVWTVEWDGK